MPQPAPYSIVAIAEQEMERRMQLKRKVTVVDILEDCCLVFNKTVAQIRSKGKTQELTSVRRIYFFVCCKLTNSSLKSISDNVLRDHTTCIHNRELVTNFLHVKDEKFMKDWNYYVKNSSIWKQYNQ